MQDRNMLTMYHYVCAREQDVTHAESSFKGAA